MQSDSPPDSITGPAVPVAPPGPSPDARTLVGRTLGRYQLVRVVGRGAMGVVYEGFDTRLGRTVAIKTVLRSFMADEDTAEDFGARFEREAQAAARLNHPNIVALFDFGEQGDISYIVMEMIRGRELAEAFKAGDRFSMPQTQRLMTELLDALGAAHDSGIVHRDVKPANVLIDETGRVKLADFGVARVVDRNQDRTLPGTMVGTPSAMAPEQIMGLAVGSRTDIFSAGLIFYQLLTGKRPFTGSGPFGVQRAIVHDEATAPSSLNSDVPKAVDAVLAKSLAKKPEQRYESARAFSVAITAAMASGPGVSPARHAPVDQEVDVDLTMVLPKPWLQAGAAAGSTLLAQATVAGTQTSASGVATQVVASTATASAATGAGLPAAHFAAPSAVAQGDLPPEVDTALPAAAPSPGSALPSPSPRLTSAPPVIAGLAFPPAAASVFAEKSVPAPMPAAVPAPVAAAVFVPALPLAETTASAAPTAVDTAAPSAAKASDRPLLAATQPWRGERSRWPLWLLLAAAAAGTGAWWTLGRAPVVPAATPGTPAAGKGGATDLRPTAPALSSSPAAPSPVLPTSPAAAVLRPSNKVPPATSAAPPAAAKPGARTPNSPTLQSAPNGSNAPTGTNADAVPAPPAARGAGAASPGTSPAAAAAPAPATVVPPTPSAAATTSAATTSTTTTSSTTTPAAPAVTSAAPAPMGTAAPAPSTNAPSAAPSYGAAPPAGNPTAPAAVGGAPKPAPAGDAAPTDASAAAAGKPVAPPARAAERKAGPNDPRCAELRSRIQLGDTLTPEQTTLFHTRCAR